MRWEDVREGDVLVWDQEEVGGLGVYVVLEAGPIRRSDTGFQRRWLKVLDLEEGRVVGYDASGKHTPSIVKVWRA